jgi:heme exporter protein B
MATGVLGAEPLNKRLGVFGAAWEVAKKDARIELRTREIVSSAGVFAIIVCILASVAFTVKPELNRPTAAGTIWVAIFFASVLSFSRIWQREREESALTALLVSPIPRASIYLGKSLATFATLFILTIPLVLVTMIFFQIDFSPPADAIRDPKAIQDPMFTHVGAFVGLVALGTASLSLIGTLFGVMTIRTRARDLALAIVLGALFAPALLCGVAGTRNAFETQPFEDYRGFLLLMALSVFVGMAVGIALFRVLVED